MDTSPNVVTETNPEALAETVRAKRVDIDNGLEVLRVRLQGMDPRRRFDARESLASRCRLSQVQAPSSGPAADAASIRWSGYSFTSSASCTRRSAILCRRSP